MINNKNMNPLVSIITPCYNGETFLHRLLDSVLAQTYRPIEFIAVDDGSNDRTIEVLETYKNRFEANGIPFLLLQQKNSGPAVALSHGLRHYNGDLVTWPDSDDFYTDEFSIEKMVKAFRRLSDGYGMIRSNAYLIRESDLSSVGKIGKKRYYFSKENLFEDCILENHFWYTPGCFMTSRHILEEVLPDYDIYPSRCGQNWQMFLPVLYKYKCKTIDEPLFSYLLRMNSVCRIGKQQRSYDYFLERYADYEQTLRHTLSRIEMTEEERSVYEKMITEKYIRKKMDLAVLYGQLPDYRNLYVRLSVQGSDRIEDRLGSIFKRTPLLYRIYKKVCRIVYDTFSR